MDEQLYLIIFALSKVLLMDKNVIKEIILAQQDFITHIELIPRAYKFEKQVNYVLVGLRRAGKTFLLYQYIRQLLQEGHSKEEILFVNFEDERINDMRKDELHLIIEAYMELYGHEPIIFLDEIQNISGWEHFVRRLADEKRRVMVTGSNAHMLSREIASALGGRFMMKEVYPFNFEEYLRWHGINLGRNWQFGQEKAKVARMFDIYFRYGGIAEAFPLEDKRGWLTSLYQKILYSDVVIRNNVRNEQSLSLLVKKLADSVLQPTSVKRLQNIIVGAGHKVTRDTVSVFLKYLKNAYLIFSISNFTDSIPERESNKKHYFYDNGLLNLFLYQPETKLLENIVAIVLYKKYGGRLFFYNRNVEIDFLIPDERTAVQVCYNINNEETAKRETGSFVALNRFKPMKKNIIVTRDDERTVKVDGITVEIIPVWKFLLM